MTLVTVLVNRACPHCVHAVDRVTALAEACGASVAAVDVSAHADLAEAYGVTSSPSVVFPFDVAVPGVPDAPTFAALARGFPLIDRSTQNKEMTA